jgi:hypothetical protein
MTDLTKEIESLTPKLRQQLHISGVNMLSDCGQRFFFRYILGIRRPPGAYVAVGSAVHDTIARNLSYKITNKELLPREDVIGLADSIFDVVVAKEPIELEEDEKKEGKTLKQVLGEAKDKAVALTGLHHDEVAPKLRTTAVNKRFSLNMDKFLKLRAKALHEAARQAQDRYMQKQLQMQARALNVAASNGLDFAGEYDIVEQYAPEAFDERIPERLVIRDTKTTTKSPSKDVAHASDQLTGYACAAQVIDGKLPDAMILDYLVRTPERHELKHVAKETTRSLNDVDTFLNRFANAVQALKTGMFVPARADWWGCSQKYCGYWDMCPYAKRPQSTIVPDIKPVQG